MSFDFPELFAFTLSPLELFVRGTVMYLFLVAIFRTLLQRDLGAVGVADVLVLVLVADAAQNAMAGEYTSIADGVVLVSTIIGWNLTFDYLAFRFPKIRRLLQPPVLRLIHDGRVLSRNMRREFLTMEELSAKLREHGVTDVAEVREAFMESDGNITVILKDNGNGKDTGNGAKKRPF